jgi:hypothetical protein
MNENDAHLLGALDDHARDQVHNARRIRGQNAERRTTDKKGRVETRPFAFKEKPNCLRGGSANWKSELVPGKRLECVLSNGKQLLLQVQVVVDRSISNVS